MTMIPILAEQLYEQFKNQYVYTTIVGPNHTWRTVKVWYKFN